MHLARPAIIVVESFSGELRGLRRDPTSLFWGHKNFSFIVKREGGPAR